MKLSLKKAIKGSNTFDLSSTHLTTMDFGTIQPTYFAEVVPNDIFHVSMSSFARLAPLAVPTFGRLECISRAFFVPMRSIWHGFEEWISRSNDQSLASSIPTISNAQLIEWISRADYSFTVSSTDKYDFYSTFDDSFKRLNSRGRWLQKIFMSLGYSINYSSDDSTTFSALPLLAFLRVFYDFIFPSQYVQSLSIGSLFQSRANFTYTNLINAYNDTLYSPYAQDYFTSAWLNPNQVGLSDNVSIVRPADNPSIRATNLRNKNQVESDSDAVRLKNDVPAAAQTSPHVDSITSYGLRVLSAISDFVTRNNIAGSRYFEQLLARFGVSSPKATPDRSVFLRSVSDPIQIQDVTATATTEGSVLGEQGAKGIQSSNGHDFSFSSESTYGYLIVLSHVMPNTGYYQGRKRHVLHKNVFDFYTPELDSIGLQPIENQELYADFRNPFDFDNGRQYGGFPGNVFGFAPRYAEYKKRDDYLTGDFRVPSASTGLESYHMMRVLSAPSSGTPLALNPKFLLVRQHEFDRIFQQQGVNNTGFDFVDTNHNFVFAYQGKIIVFEDNGLCFTLVSSSNAGSRQPSVLRDVVSLQHFNNFAAAQVYYDTDNIVSSNNVQSLSNVTCGEDSLLFTFADITVTVTFEGNGYVIVTNKSGVEGEGIDFFKASLLDYFDHFYSIFRYDVKASRTMLSISESMPIEDGGDSVSVDYEGFNFGM